MRVVLSLSLAVAALPAAANGHRAMTPRDVREPNHQLDKMEREMAWFDKWVLGDGK